MREGGRDMEPRAVERFSETMADEEPEPQMLVPYGMVNFMGISAESGRDVGRGDHVEAIFRPSVGCLSMRVAVNTRKVGDVLPPTHEVDIYGPAASVNERSNCHTKGDRCRHLSGLLVKGVQHPSGPDEIRASPPQQRRDLGGRVNVQGLEKPV
jgi:hypothetical protein